MAMKKYEIMKVSEKKGAAGKFFAVLGTKTESEPIPLLGTVVGYVKPIHLNLGSSEPAASNIGNAVELDKTKFQVEVGPYTPDGSTKEIEVEWWTPRVKE